MPLKLVKRKSPFWYIRGTVRGVNVDESTGVTDREAADAIRAKREVEIINATVFGRKATATFLEAAVSYMEAGGERRFLGKILDYFKTTPLAEIDQAAIERAAIKLYPKASSATRNRQLFTPLSAILKHAHKMGLCEALTVERPKQPTGKVRWITPQEAGRLIAACSNHLRPLVIFLLYTGARVSEALYLDWRDVDLDAGRVAFHDTKNGESRGVPLHPVVVNALSALKHRSGAVFRRPDRKGYAVIENAGGQIKTAFRGACKRAKIEGFTPHDCRHTFATWHYARNRDPRGLMELCGWKSERMVWRYAHINRDELAPGVNNIPAIAMPKQAKQ